MGRPANLNGKQIPGSGQEGTRNQGLGKGRRGRGRGEDPPSRSHTRAR